MLALRAGLGCSQGMFSGLGWHGPTQRREEKEKKDVTPTSRVGRGCYGDADGRRQSSLRSESRAMPGYGVRGQLRKV